MRRDALVSILSSLLLAVAAHPCAAVDGKELILDYDVPESPAMVALGVSPSNILRAGAAKPVAADLLNNILTSGGVQHGLALDFSPYLTYNAPHDVAQYQKDRWKQVLANTTLSFATVQDTTIAEDLLFGLGIRATLWDDHDLLAHTDLYTDVTKKLADLADADAPTSSEGEVGSPIKLPDNPLSGLYDEARSAVADHPGWAVAIGYGSRGRLRHGIARKDSVGRMTNRLWLSGTRYFGHGLDALGTVQWIQKQTDTTKSVVRAGIAFRQHTSRYAFALEGYYDTEQDGSGSALGIGGQTEINVVKGIALLGTLTTEPEIVSGHALPRVKLKTSVRWTMAESK